MNFKSILFIGAIGVMVSLAAYTTPEKALQKEEHKASNLKILPKDISHKQLDSVMHGFNDALGVKCGFCHAASKDNGKRLDFASDEKKEKLISRDMMKMTAKINDKYFKSHEKNVATMKCITCHRGSEYP